MQVKLLTFDTPDYQILLQGLTYDIYHLPGYILAEADRIEAQAAAISITEGAKLFLLPYLLRPCPAALCHDVAETLYDAVSPYGYPGPLLNEAAQADSSFFQNALKQLIVTFQSQGICSIFVRLHPILNADIQKCLDNITINDDGTTVSIDLTVSESEQWQQIQSSRRTKINRARRQNFALKIAPFLPEYIPLFMDIYQETMNRLNAKKSYYFNLSYYEAMSRLSPHFFICLIDIEEQPICGGIFTECCGIVQYHLGGTKEEFLKLSPSNLMFDEVRRWAKLRGNHLLHLGGGLGGKEDSLFNFKASFSKKRHQFCTLRLITDSVSYVKLIQSRAIQINMDPDQLINDSFFPAYRRQSI